MAQGVDPGQQRTVADFATTMKNVHAAIQAIAPTDSREALEAEGVAVANGDARFLSERSLWLEGKEIRFAQALIATAIGALAARGLFAGWAPFPRTLTVLLFGVVLVLVAVAVPYTTFVLRTAYAGHDIGFEEGDRTLGASRRHVLLRVHLPLIAPDIQTVHRSSAPYPHWHQSRCARRNLHCAAWP